MHSLRSRLGPLLITLAFVSGSLTTASASPATGGTGDITEAAQQCSLGADRPYYGGGTLFWAARSGCSTELEALLSWSRTGPDTIGYVSRYGTYVQGSRLCNWGPPTNRTLYTTAISPFGEVRSSSITLHSGSSGCGVP